MRQKISSEISPASSNAAVFVFVSRHRAPGLLHDNDNDGKRAQQRLHPHTTRCAVNDDDDDDGRYIFVLNTCALQEH